MNEWDRQIKELKRKQELKQKPEKEINLGRCSCGCGRFRLKIVSGQLMRTCYKCEDKKEV